MRDFLRKSQSKKKRGAPQSLCAPKEKKTRTASNPSGLNQEEKNVFNMKKEKETCLYKMTFHVHICLLLWFYLRCMLQHTHTHKQNLKQNKSVVCFELTPIILKMRRVTNRSGNLNGFCRQNLSFLHNYYDLMLMCICFIVR